jgi:hypothetical protein
MSKQTRNKTSEFIDDTLVDTDEGVYHRTLYTPLWRDGSQIIRNVISETTIQIFDQAMFVHKPLTHHGAAGHSTVHIYLSWPEIISRRLVRRFLRQLASCDSSQLVIKGTRTPLQQETRYDTNSCNDLKDTCFVQHNETSEYVLFSPLMTIFFFLPRLNDGWTRFIINYWHCPLESLEQPLKILHVFRHLNFFKFSWCSTFWGWLMEDSLYFIG